MKETLKPQAYEPSEEGLSREGERLLACLLKNEPASHHSWRGEGFVALCRSESESEEGASPSFSFGRERGDRVGCGGPETA